MPKSTKTTSSPAEVNSGTLIAAYLKKHRIYKAALARMLHRSPTTIYDFMKRSSIQTEILWELSLALKHNFFAEIAALLPADFTPENAALAAKNLEIEQLQQKLERVQSEKELLMQLLKR